MYKRFLFVFFFLLLMITFSFSVLAADTVASDVKNGILAEQGNLYYYEDGVRVAKGMVFDEYSQKYYYFGKDLYALNEGTYHLQLKNLNGLSDPFGNPLTAGYYQVYSDHSVNPYSFSKKNGIVVDSDGETRFYVNDVRTFAGVVQDSQGNYLYINHFLVAVKSQSVYISKTNELIEPGTYDVDENGYIIDPLIISSYDELYYIKRIFILIFILAGFTIAGIFIARPRRWL